MFPTPRGLALYIANQFHCVCNETLHIYTQGDVGEIGGVLGDYCTWGNV